MACVNMQALCLQSHWSDADRRVSFGRINRFIVCFFSFFVLLAFGFVVLDF